MIKLKQFFRKEKLEEKRQDEFAKMPLLEKMPAKKIAAKNKEISKDEKEATAKARVRIFKKLTSHYADMPRNELLDLGKDSCSSTLMVCMSSLVCFVCKQMIVGEIMLAVAAVGTVRAMLILYQILKNK